MKKVDRVVKVGIFAGIAFLLQMLGGMLPKVSGFLEMEISDLPAILLAFSIGPVAGVLVEFIKNLLHLFVTTTGGVGEAANFCINGILVMVCGLIYKHRKTRKYALIALITGVLFMAAASVLVNVFVMLPLYMKDVDLAGRFNLALSIIAPFNIIRGTVLSVITMLAYKKVSQYFK